MDLTGKPYPSLTAIQKSGQAKRASGISYLMDPTNQVTNFDAVDNTPTNASGRVSTVPGQYSNRSSHRGNCNILFPDGHVQSRAKKEMMRNNINIILKLFLHIKQQRLKKFKKLH